MSEAINVSGNAQTTTISLPTALHGVLEQSVGETPVQKISRLLCNELRRSLQTCEQELLELEMKYGIDYSEFQHQLASGDLGDAFGYALEMDALRWDDLRAEKQHYLHQLKLLKTYL